jgi:hypothetical protein
LLRLTPAQLYELSTDVFDELMRRQSPASLNNPPAFLLPNNAFSSRRNQARQRLSAVGPPRFRDLVADVYYEIKRRFPHLRELTSSGRKIARRPKATSLTLDRAPRSTDLPQGAKVA